MPSLFFSNSIITVAVRNHISTLKHSIRHQQAQLHNLENIVLRGPRPYPPGIMPSSHSPSASTVDLTSSTSDSTAPSSYSHQNHNGQPQSPSPPNRESISSSPKAMRRRSSFDILHNIAPDSSLPLPKRESMRQDGGIREGVPMEFGVSQAHLGHHKRVSSPTRTYSRASLTFISSSIAAHAYFKGIPVSSVGRSFLLFYLTAPTNAPTQSFPCQ